MHSQHTFINTVVCHPTCVPCTAKITLAQISDALSSNNALRINLLKTPAIFVHIEGELPLSNAVKADKFVETSRILLMCLS